MGNFGKIELYTGEGKGKTTAAAGLAARMLGNGYRVLFVQFMKSMPSGEVTMLQKCAPKALTLLRNWDGSFIIAEATPAQTELCRTLWHTFEKRLQSVHYDLLVLDEVVVATAYRLIEESTLLAFLEKRPEHLEIVMTGRGASQKLIEASDLVTEMRKIKHYYDKGVMARRGIEY